MNVVPPTSALSSLAKLFVTSHYAQVYTIDELKRALVQFGPCYISFPVYDKFKSKFWNRQDEDSVSLGGHAVTVVGYNDVGFILRNSWGKYWNLDGHVTYPYTEWKSHWEIFSPVDVTGSPPIDPPPRCWNIPNICNII